MALTTAQNANLLTLIKNDPKGLGFSQWIDATGTVRTPPAGDGFDTGICNLFNSLTGKGVDPAGKPAAPMDANDFAKLTFTSFGLLTLPQQASMKFLIDSGPVQVGDSALLADLLSIFDATNFASTHQALIVASTQPATYAEVQFGAGYVLTTTDVRSCGIIIPA